MNKLLFLLLLCLTTTISAFSQITDVQLYSADEAKVRAISFSEDSKFLLVKSGDQPIMNKGFLTSPAINVWDLETGKNTMRFIEKELSKASAFSQDGKYFAFREKNFINVMDMKTQKIFSKIKFSDKKTDFAKPIAFTSDNKSVIIDFNSSTLLYKVENGQYERSLNIRGTNPLKSSDDKYIIKSFTDNFCLYDFETAKEIHTFYCGSGEKKAQEELKSVHFSADNRFVVTLSNNIVRLWDLVTYKVIQSFDIPVGEAIYGFSPDNRYVFGGGDSLRLWEIGTKRMINTPIYSGSKEVHYTAAAFSPDGKYLAAGDAKGQVSLWYFSYDNIATAYFEKEIRNEYKQLPQKGEFEKTNEYNARFQKQSKVIRERFLEKYVEEVINTQTFLSKVDEQVQIDQEQHRRKIAESLSMINFNIQSISNYNADKETFTITIMNENEHFSKQQVIKVPRKDNPICFKQNYESIIISGVKQLQDDGKNYDYFNIKLKSSCSGKDIEYPFGIQKRPLYID